MGSPDKKQIDGLGGSQSVANVAINVLLSALGVFGLGGIFY